MNQWLLTLITFVPLLGMILILCLPGERLGLIRSVSVAITGVVFALTLALWRVFDPAAIAVGTVGNLYAGYDAKTFVDLPWIDSFYIHYRFGVTGSACC
jgi:NADH:ubiquinone oxidoreductase subunit 4 (subunit M)